MKFLNKFLSAEYHFKKHGKEVGANDFSQYLRKAEEFARTSKKVQQIVMSMGQLMVQFAIKRVVNI